MTGQTLKGYLTNCQLPPIDLEDCEHQQPPIGHKSHLNHLKVRPEEWRRLESIHPLSENISTFARNWTEANVMDDEPINFDALLRQRKQLLLPCPPTVDINQIYLLPPDTVEILSMWIQALPLRTVQTIIHLLYPEYSGWKFRLVDDREDYDRDIMRYCEWTEYTSSGQNRHQQSSPSLIVAFQPSWILSEQDMEEFAHCRSFPRFRRAGCAFPSPLDSHHRVWAKLWDICARRNVRWFVLTSYSHWVFGGFSEGWSSGFITGIYPYSSTQPSIAEMLTFWVASSMEVAGSASLPKVTEPLDYQIGSILIPTSAPTNGFEIPSDSESNWEGKSDTVDSSAGVFSQLSDADSLDSMATVRARHRQQLHEPLIQQWMANTGEGYPGPPSAIMLHAPTRSNTRRTAGTWLF